MTDKKEYTERDIEEQGDFYMKHVSAMTGEKLHSKSDIAAELAHRDIKNNGLEKDFKELQHHNQVQNSLLRSAYQIADRDGINTNWKAFKNNLENELTKHLQLKQALLRATSTTVTYRLPHESDTKTEKLEWSANYERRRTIDGDVEIFVESEDFTHDVRLYVNGDFESDEQKMRYAKSIADKLNSK